MPSLSQRTERVPDQVASSRARRVSLLPTSVTSASLSYKSRPTSSFAPPSSSPARGTSKKTTTVTASSTLRRRLSSSNLSVPSSTLSSAIGKRRSNVSPDKDKGDGTNIEEETAAHSHPIVSEFGAIQHVSPESPAGKSTIQPRHTVSGQSIKTARQPVLLSKSSRASLRPSTAGGRPPTSETLPLKLATSSNIPRPRTGTSTPTQSLITARQNGHAKAAGTTLATKSPTFQLKPLASSDHAKLPTSNTTFSIRSRAAVWERLNDSCSSPSPSPRLRNPHQSTPTSVSASQSRPTDLMLSESFPQVQQGALPPRSRRISMMPLITQPLHIHPNRSRRSSLIATTPAASVHIKAAAPVQTITIESEAHRIKGEGDDEWGQWSASTPAQCDSDTVKTTDQTEEDSQASLSVNDFLNASLLLEGKMLDELDAEVGRLGLDENTTVVELITKGLDIAQECEAVNQVEHRHELLLQDMRKQRDDAIHHEAQAQKELQAVKVEIEHCRAAIAENEYRAHGRKETTTQTFDQIGATEGVTNPAELSLLQRQNNQTEATLTELQYESICQSWKHAMDLACSHLDSLESQTEMCNYLFAQIEMYQQSIVQCRSD